MTKKKDPKDFKKNGRPTLYTEELCDEICNFIASTQQGLDSLCSENPHWPTRQNIFVWLRKYPEFYAKYTRAKEHQAEVCVDYMQDLMNEPHRFVDEKGVKRVDVQMIRTKIDAIKWQASKLLPKKFGEAHQIHNNNNQVHSETMSHKAALDEQNKKEF